MSFKRLLSLVFLVVIGALLAGQANAAAVSIKQQESRLTDDLGDWSRTTLYYEGPFDRISSLYVYGSRSRWFGQTDYSIAVGERFFPDEKLGFFVEVGGSPTREISPQTDGAVGVRYSDPEHDYTLRVRGDYSKYPDGDEPKKMNISFQKTVGELRYELNYSPSWTDSGTFGDQEGITATWLYFSPHYLQVDFQDGDNITDTRGGPLRTDYSRRSAQIGYYLGHNWTLTAKAGVEDISGLYTREFGSIGLQWAVSSVELGARMDETGAD